MVFCDNGRFVWEPGTNRVIDMAQLSSASDGYFTLYWGAPGSTPLVVIPRGVPELDVVEGEVVGGVTSEGEAVEGEVTQTTVVMEAEDNEEQQVRGGCQELGMALMVMSLLVQPV